LTHLPNSHPSVCGVALLRNKSLPIIDLSKAIGKLPQHQKERNGDQGSVIVTEFNRTMQGFLVERVDRIIVRDWKDILPPSGTLGSKSYMTGVTNVDGNLVQILDVENILGSVSPLAINIVANELDVSEVVQGKVLVVDDSALARKQTAETLEAINLPFITAKNGKEALALLKKCNLDNSDNSDYIAMVVSDIEMPEMDGYSLTQNIRQEKGLENMYVLLHTSLNGAINIEKAKQAGANDMLTKFIPEELMDKIVTGLQSIK
ncbi:MAG: chemotaxis protein, partial [Gammaproteobacteria bacterium]|nr:chemotaxis protein [Gammaproteobacteria bacterium]